MKKNFTSYFAVCFLLSAFCLLPSSGALAQNSFPTSNTITLVEDTVITYTITASVIGLGMIDPKGIITVPYGENITFRMAGAIGYSHIKLIWIDGKEFLDELCKGGDCEYTFTNVTSNHTIVAEFEDSYGIDENEYSYLFIYPNPTNSEFRIYNSKFRITNSEFRIYDITGKKLMKQILTDETTTVNISHLLSGIYFLKIDNQTFKIIKN